MHFEFLWALHSLRPVGLQVVRVVRLEAALLLRLVFLNSFVLHHLLRLLQRLRPVCSWLVHIDTTIGKQLLVYAEHFPAGSRFYFGHLIRRACFVYRLGLAYFVFFRCHLSILGAFIRYLRYALLFTK